jgi:hypothetical protein
MPTRRRMSLRAWTLLIVALVAAGGLAWGAAHGARRAIHQSVEQKGLPPDTGVRR